MAETNPQSIENPTSPEESLAVIDQVLEVEDPEFHEEMKALKEAGSAPESVAIVLPELNAMVDIIVDSDVDRLLEIEKKERAAKGLRRLNLLLVIKPWRKIRQITVSVKAIWPWLKLTALPSMKTGTLAFMRTLKEAAQWLLHHVKSGLIWFGRRSWQMKILIVAIAILTAAAAAMARFAIHGSFLPSLGQDFLFSFSEEADRSFTYPTDEAWQDLNDPLLHPEHMVLLERLIVNLHAPGDGSNPMALLDLFIEVGTQEGAVEIKDRDSEIRDLVLRTVEQTSYDELVTEAGKNKLKVFLRKNLNDLLSRGRVRRIYFKSIVLKP